MTGAEQIAALAALVASTGAATRVTRLRFIHDCGVPLLCVGWLGLIVAVMPSSLRERWPLLLLATIIVAGVCWLAARVLVGSERWLLAAGALVLTLRVPVPTGDGTSMLLGPLYLVIALGALALMRGDWLARRSGEAPRLLPHHGGATRMLDVGTATLPIVATMSLVWSYDPTASAEALTFFLVPFVLAYAIVRSWLSAGTTFRPAGIALVTGGVLAAVIGLVQATTRHVWWNPKVIDANRFRADFRTNSIYWDPNIYGRALVITLLAIIGWMLVARLGARRGIAGAGLCALMTAALWSTYSQSSWIALAASLTIIAVLTLPPRIRRWAALALVVGVLAALPAASKQLAGTDEQSRRDVVGTGLSLAGERPVLGWGVGTFEQAARARATAAGDRAPGLLASHTTPVTVFAELGVIGMFAYLTLLTSAAVAVLARWRRTSTPASAARARGEASPDDHGWPIAPIIWATGTLAALFAHSLLYAGFFEDATLWVALAVLASLPLTSGDDERGESIHLPDEDIEGAPAEATAPSV